MNYDRHATDNRVNADSNLTPMEVVTGALPSVITKLADLAAGEYNLQKGLKGEIMFLRPELQSMKTEECPGGDNQGSVQRA